MKNRGAYKRTHIRIIDDPPPVDYDELKRLQTKYCDAFKIRQEHPWWEIRRQKKMKAREDDEKEQ